jgi:hypothetical protein
VPIAADGSLLPPSAAFELPISGDLVYEAGFNANGIVASRKGLIIVQSITGKLFSADPRPARPARLISGAWTS